MVTAEEDAHAADTDEDAEDLRPMITHMEEGEGENHHENDGPEVDELRRQDGSVSVSKYGEVVTLHVEE